MGLIGDSIEVWEVNAIILMRYLFSSLNRCSVLMHRELGTPASALVGGLLGGDAPRGTTVYLFEGKNPFLFFTATYRLRALTNRDFFGQCWTQYYPFFIPKIVSVGTGGG